MTANAKPATPRYDALMESPKGDAFIDALANLAHNMEQDRSRLVAALREVVDPSGGWRNLRVDNAKSAAALLRDLGEL